MLPDASHDDSTRPSMISASASDPSSSEAKAATTPVKQVAKVSLS